MSRPQLPRRRENGRFVIPFNKDEMERICVRVARGASLEKVMKDGQWSISVDTVYRWMNDYPEAREMIYNARLLRSFAWEDKSMELVGRLERGEVEKEQIRAVDVALHHTRWLMGKWNMADFGDHRQTTPTIAIQINSNVLGNDGEEYKDPRVMTIAAPIPEDYDGAETG